MKQTNWGIIGPGNIATEFIADLPLAAEGQAVIAVLGRRIESVNEFADQYDIPGRYVSIEEFINNGKPDVVYVATPHPLHYEETKLCLQHKIPVLCEKPLCLNAEQCSDLIEIAKQNNTFLMEGMWIRFLPPVCKVLELLRENRIGDITSIFASMNFKAPDDPGSRYFNPSLGGGSLLDLGIYPVFLSVLLAGKPGNIKAIASLTDRGVDKICSAVFKHNAGQHSIIESSLIKNSDMPAIINGSLGSMKILHPWFEKSPGVEIVLNNGQQSNYPFAWEGHGLHFEISEVLNCLAKGKTESDKMTHQFSLDMAVVMDEIRNQSGVKYELFE